MKKRLFLSCFVSLFIVLSFSLYSCQQNTPETDNSEQFQAGVEQGWADAFLSLYNSIGFENEKILLYGDTWDTEHFTLTIYDKITPDEAYISYDLILKNTTVEHCHDFESFFFNIYAISDTEGMILTSDDFIWDGSLNYEGSTDEYLAGNYVKGTCELLDNSKIQSLIIIISTKGHLYSATYQT